jgi:hypothetical protein
LLRLRARERSDIKDGFPGELRVQLCRVKTSAMNAGGTVPVANAGAPRARRRERTHDRRSRERQ